MRFQDLLNEDLAKWNTGKWIHYSDYEVMKINPTPFHQDPLGIYFFPESFKKPASMWTNKKYKFTVTLKPNVKILDWAKMTDQQRDQLLVATGAKKDFDMTMERYPEENREKMLGVVWNSMRDSMMLSSGGPGKAKWNTLIRQCGWDAIFDDTGSIHVAEVQLLVLNPTIFASITSQTAGFSSFKKIKEIMAEIEKFCKTLGDDSIEVETNGPKKTSDSWTGRGRKGDPMILKGTVDVKKSENNYARISVSQDPNSEHRKNVINVGISYSNPSLGYGAGAEFDLATKQWSKYSNLEKFYDDLKRIFLPPDSANN